MKVEELGAAKRQSAFAVETTAARQEKENLVHLEKHKADEAMLVSVQGQLGRLQDKLASERVQFKEEIAALRARKSSELEAVSLRVRETLAKKDAIIHGLQDQLGEAEVAIRELNSLA